MCLTKSGNAILSPEKSTANVRQRIKPVTNNQLTDCFFIRCLRFVVLYPLIP